MKDEIEQIIRDYFDDGSRYISDGEFERCANDITELIKRRR